MIYNIHNMNTLKELKGNFYIIQKTPCENGIKYMYKCDNIISYNIENNTVYVKIINSIRFNNERLLAFIDHFDYNISDTYSLDYNYITDNLQEDFPEIYNILKVEFKTAYRKFII